MDLPAEPRSRETSIFEVGWPHQELPGLVSWQEFSHYELHKDATGQHIKFHAGPVKERLREEKLPPDAEVTFRFQYVAKASAAQAARKRKRA